MINPKIQEMLDLAAKDVNRLRAAKSSRSARDAWIDFLEHSNRAINRLEGYSKKTKQHDRYMRFKKEELWSSPLSKYMRVARNAHEHGISDTQLDDPFHERVMLPNGALIGIPNIIVETEAGEVSYLRASGPMELTGTPGFRRISLPPTILLIPIEAPSGEWVHPPHAPALEDKNESVPAALARSYLQWIIEAILTFS